jgi:hypothetical protein
VLEAMMAEIQRILLAALLDAAPADVPVLMTHEDDPVEDGPFIRLHPVMEGPRSAGDPIHRGLIARVGVQVPVSALAADGHALAALADTVRGALAGRRLAGSGVALTIADGVVRVSAADPALRLQDAQVDFTAYAQVIA